MRQPSDGMPSRQPGALPTRQTMTDQANGLGGGDLRARGPELPSRGPGVPSRGPELPSRGAELPPRGVEMPTRAPEIPSRGLPDLPPRGMDRGETFPTGKET